MKRPRPKILFVRKLGHLWSAFYGMPGNGKYGYGASRKEAIKKARAA